MTGTRRPFRVSGLNLAGFLGHYYNPEIILGTRYARRPFPLGLLFIGLLLMLVYPWFSTEKERVGDYFSGENLAESPCTFAGAMESPGSHWRLFPRILMTARSYP